MKQWGVAEMSHPISILRIGLGEYHTHPVCVKRKVF